MAKGRVEADWEKIDRFDHAGVKSYHGQALGEDWATFMEYKDIFMRTMQGHRLEDLKYAVLLWNDESHWNNTLEGFTHLATSKISYYGGRLSLELGKPDDSGRVIMYADQELRVEATTKMEKNRKGKAKLLIHLLPETAQSSNIIVPVVRWRRYKGGEIQMVFESLEGLDLAKCLELLQDQPPDDLHFDARRLNPVAGFLTVPYLLREIVDEWPEEESLTEDGPKRPVGPAQIPASALRRKAESLQSIYFRRAEEYVQDTAA